MQLRGLYRSMSMGYPYRKPRRLLEVIGWLKTVSLFFNTNSLIDQFYQTFSFKVSNKCPIIAPQVVIIFPM